MLQTIPLVRSGAQSQVASPKLLLSSYFIFYFLNSEVISGLGKMNEACEFGECFPVSGC